MLKHIILALSLLWTSQAVAADHVGPRYEWFYDIGYLHAIGGSPTAWSETIDGVETFHFIQTNRTDLYVELYDASRQLYVRLFADRMTMKLAHEAYFTFFQAGNWDDRRMYSYRYSDGSIAYLLIGPSEVWKWVRPGQPTVYLRETFRNGDQIQLFNARDNYTLSLLDGQFWLKQGDGAWAKIADASWGL